MFLVYIGNICWIFLWKENYVAASRQEYRGGCLLHLIRSVKFEKISLTSTYGSQFKLDNDSVNSKNHIPY